MDLFLRVNSVGNDFPSAEALWGNAVAAWQRARERFEDDPECQSAYLDMLAANARLREARAILAQHGAHCRMLGHHLDSLAAQIADRETDRRWARRVWAVAGVLVAAVAVAQVMGR